jgi:hypothetical protein
MPGSEINDKDEWDKEMREQPEREDFCRRCLWRGILVRGMSGLGQVYQRAVEAVSPSGIVWKEVLLS